MAGSRKTGNARGLVVALIIVLCSVPPLSTDMLMPALPDIAEYFATSTSLVSFTITEFFIGMSVGMLVLGSASDRFGRKPVLFASVGISLLFALVSALSVSIYMLLVARFIQSLGAGGMVALGTALVKDCFGGKTMSRMLAIVTAISMLAPLFAPVIGAVVLTVIGWRGSFYVNAALYVVALVGTLLLKEPLAQENRITERVSGAIGRVFSILRDKSFTAILLVGAVAAGPFMSYLAVSSFAYTNVFGTSASEFSAFFAANAVLSLVGTFVFMRFGAPNARRACGVSLVIGLVSAALVLVFGHISPFAFLVSYAPYSATVNYLKPMITDALLKTRDQDVGAASSLINFAFTMVGAIIMTVNSVEIGDYVYTIAISMVTWIVVAAVIWVATGKRRGATEGK